jgi:hypothetical protein
MNIRTVPWWFGPITTLQGNGFKCHHSHIQLLRHSQIDHPSLSYGNLLARWWKNWQPKCCQSFCCKRMWTLGNPKGLSQSQDKQLLNHSLSWCFSAQCKGVQLLTCAHSEGILVRNWHYRKCRLAQHVAALYL